MRYIAAFMIIGTILSAAALNAAGRQQAAEERQISRGKRV